MTDESLAAKWRSQGCRQRGKAGDTVRKWDTGLCMQQELNATQDGKKQVARSYNCAVPLDYNSVCFTGLPVGRASPSSLQCWA